MNRTHTPNPSRQANRSDDTNVNDVAASLSAVTCTRNTNLEKKGQLRVCNCKKTCIMSCHDGCPCHSSDLQKTPKLNSCSKFRCRRGPKQLQGNDVEQTLEAVDGLQH